MEDFKGYFMPQISCLYIYIFIYMCVCVYNYIYIYICVCVYIYNYIYIFIYVCVYNYIYKSDLYIRFDLYIYISILRFAPQNSFYEYNILYLWVDVPYFECWPIDLLWQHERGDLGLKKEWRVLHVGLGEQKTGSSCYLTL